MANSPQTERPDLQDLIAYIEGRGSETLRAQVLQRLDEDEQYLELMVDLVPALRDAGLIAPPAAEPTAEESTAEESTAAEPPPAKIIGHASRFRLPFVLTAALAALVPIAVGISMFFRSPVLTPRLLAQALSQNREIQEHQPLSRSTRGGGLDVPEATQLPKQLSKRDYFRAGTQFVDLELARLRGKSIETQLDALEKTLKDDPLLAAFFKFLSKGQDTKVDLQEELDNVYLELLPREMTLYVEQGACVRGAWLAFKANDPELGKSLPGCARVVGEEVWQSATEETLWEMLEAETVKTEID